MFDLERRYGVDQELAGKKAECDGGGSYPSVMPNGEWGLMPSRDLFKGLLTGAYFETGNISWRWYEMVILKDKPSNYPDEAVWCERGFLFVMDEAPESP